MPVKVITITGGKGGIGKSSVAINLAASLSRLGRSVLLLDGDFGLANLDQLLDCKPERNLSHIIDGTTSLKDVILDAPEGLQLVPGTPGNPRMAELSEAELAGLIHSFSELTQDLDYLIVDTAPGVSRNVVTLCRAASDLLTVVCDEPASINDAYNLIRLATEEDGVQHVHMLANMMRAPQQGRSLYDTLLQACDRSLEVALTYLGDVPLDDHVRESVQRQEPLISLFPNCPASRALQAVARRVDQLPLPSAPRGQVEFFMERLLRYRASMEQSR